MRVIMKLLLFSLFLIACARTDSNPETLFSFPRELSELSGMTLINNQLYTIQDSGNKAEIIVVDLKGEIKRRIKIENASNSDWEDITADPEGNVYIGDIGNNFNQRFSLRIYKIDKKDLGGNTVSYTEKTEFSYPEQKDFPPKKAERFYDAEAFFFYKGNFYLFTKNRSTKNSAFTSLYRIPAKKGKFDAQLLGELDTCSDFHSCAITSAAISPDNKRVALLAGENVWLLENFPGDDFLKGKTTKIPLGELTQKESICFADNHTLYIGDEKKKKSGGKLYKLELK